MNEQTDLLGGDRPDLTEDALAKALTRIEELRRQPELEPLPVETGDADATDFLKSLDAKLDRLGLDTRTVADAFAAQTPAVAALKAENAELRKSLAAVDSRIEEMAKAMRLPLAPRAQIGAVQPVPHPNGDQAGEGAAPLEMTRDALCKALTERWKASTDMTLRAAISEEVGRITAGMPATPSLLKSLGIVK